MLNKELLMMRCRSDLATVIVNVIAGEGGSAILNVTDITANNVVLTVSLRDWGPHTVYVPINHTLKMVTETSYDFDWRFSEFVGCEQVSKDSVKILAMDASFGVRPKL